MKLLETREQVVDFLNNYLPENLNGFGLLDQVENHKYLFTDEMYDWLTDQFSSSETIVIYDVDTYVNSYEMLNIVIDTIFNHLGCENLEDDFYEHFSDEFWSYFEYTEITEYFLENDELRCVLDITYDEIWNNLESVIKDYIDDLN